MAKTLPIQFVKTRGDRDKFLKEAGGSDELPNWATLQLIQENAFRLISTLDTIQISFQNRTARNSQLPLLIKAKLNEHATAKSYRPNVRAILNQRHKQNVIGISGFREILFKVDSTNDIDEIRQVIVSVQTQTSSKDKPIGVAAIEDMAIFTCLSNIEDLQGKLVKIQLANYKDYRLNSLSERLLIEACHEVGYEIERVNYADDLIIFKISNPSREALQQIATLDSVISIKEMPYYELVAAPNPLQTEINLAKPALEEKYPVLGILDSGVEASEYLSSWQLGDEDNTAGLEENEIDRKHGSMVASIAVYGDSLEGKEYTGCGPLNFVSCIVNSDCAGLSISEDEFVMHIRNAVQKFPDVKIWNLSQGSQSEVSDSVFSDFAIALDDIQKKNNVLICKSAGNCRNAFGRITYGAESIRALTVGSICHAGSHPEDLVEGSHSPFSRIGYGPENLIKPEVVHFGGNVHTGIKVLTGADYQHTARGTSFSTPRVATLASHLYHRIGGDFNSTLIKALIVHNADYPVLVDKTIVEHDKLYGFGLPSPIEDILNNDVDEFTMIWQPDFNNGADFQIIDFPFPESLVDEEGYFYGIISVTIATDPVLKSSEGNEYCQTDVDVKIGPAERVEHFAIGAVGTPKTYRNEDRIKSFHNILTENKYTTRQPELMRERNLIMKNHKWQPIKKYRVDLSTMRPAVKRDIKNRPIWAMTIKAISRDATTLELLEDGVVNDIKATIIITIRDPHNKGQVYNESMRLLDLRNFEHTNIMVNNDIHLQSDALM